MAVGPRLHLHSMLLKCQKARRLRKPLFGAPLLIFPSRFTHNRNLLKTTFQGSSVSLTVEVEPAVRLHGPEGC